MQTNHDLLRLNDQLS